MPSQLALRKAVAAWATKETWRKPYDDDLALAFAEILDSILSQPWLGNATTAELLNELSARAELGGYANYKTTNPTYKYERTKSPLDDTKWVKVAETKYPWNLAPDWATCAATDLNGKAYWYSNPNIEFDLDKGVWGASNEGSRWTLIYGAFPTGGWTYSKETRSK
jgi:hypothetical protein